MKTMKETQSAEINHRKSFTGLTLPLIHRMTPKEKMPRAL